MPLTTCPDCGAAISTSAEACVQCGCPVSGPIATRSSKTQLVEHTAKRYKAWMLLGGSLIILSIAIALVGVSQSDSETSVGWMAASILVFLVGGIGYISARLLAWWNHA